MGGSACDVEWEYSSWPPNEVRTLVLIGKIGNGKSSTGNSIIGQRLFTAKSSSNSVTCTSELHSTALQDGRILTVIDTPGLSDLSTDPEYVKKEIVKCIDMARGGIHALLLVLSVRARFSREEEEACIQSLNYIFGGNISDFMIVVFTGGDDLGRDGVTLDDYVGRNCQPLKKILRKCDNRRVLFDNATTDETKKANQMNQLLFLVNEVVDSNGGKPFTNELFIELKSTTTELTDQTSEGTAAVGCTKQEFSNVTEQLKRLTETVESRLKETTDHLRQQLADERAARLHAEASVDAHREKLNDEILSVRNELKKAKEETKELRRQAQGIRCVVM